MRGADVPDPPTPNWIKGVGAIAGLLSAVALVIGAIFGVRAVIGERTAPGSPTIAPDWAKPAAQPSSDTVSTRRPAPIFEHVDTLTIPGKSQKGVKVDIVKTGNYRFTYVNGEYSVYALGKEPSGFNPWLTSVIVFKGDRAPFNGETLDKSMSILRIEDNAYSATTAEARVKASERDELFVRLAAGDVITLIAVDHYSAYFDNPGEVKIDLAVSAP